MPAMPIAGSRNPEAARFACCTEIFAFSGVSAASTESIGPAVPDSFMAPPEGVLAVIENGKDEAKEKFLTSILTLSYTLCGWPAFAFDTVSFPSFTLNLATVRFGLLPPELFSLGAVCSGEGFAAFGEVLGAWFSEGAWPCVGGADAFFP